MFYSKIFLKILKNCLHNCCTYLLEKENFFKDNLEKEEGVLKGKKDHIEKEADLQKEEANFLKKEVDLLKGDESLLQKEVDLIGK